MATYADELAQDLEDSGSENEETEDVPTAIQANGLHHAGPSNADTEMDVDEENDDEADIDDVEQITVEPVEDAEAAKAKVEKMQLGAVDDVRSVAGLMQTLRPILEVRR